jgi:hypothetical protein
MNEPVKPVIPAKAREGGNPVRFFQPNGCQSKNGGALRRKLCSWIKHRKYSALRDGLAKQAIEQVSGKPFGCPAFAGMTRLIRATG